METRVAALEQIARDTVATLQRLDRRLDTVVAEQRSDFRWVLGVMLGGFSVVMGVMAHGFHWL